MDDFVGNPIFSMDETGTEDLDFLTGLTQLLAEHIPLPVLAAILVRLDTLICSVENNNAEGFMLATVSEDNKLAVYVSTEEGDEVIESPIPERLDHYERPKWIINTIQGISHRKNLMTDPVLCQCFCGYGGTPDEWLGVLIPNMI